MKYFIQRDRWEDHRDFETWQRAQLMCIIFGRAHLDRIPPLPKGYEEYGARWFASEAAKAGRDLEWGWQTPFLSTPELYPQPKGL